MINPKNVLVVTTSSIDGLKIKKYLRPVSAHLVAGTNAFTDLLGGLTDVFGGRSNAYQEQLSSLYDEAIEKIKHNAHEIGANCVIGLNIDMDEISGKGKSMFMLTAIGTAVLIENNNTENSSPILSEKLENIGYEKINILRQKKDIIDKAIKGNLNYYNEGIWNFITKNQVDEIFPFLIKTHSEEVESFELTFESNNAFNKNFIIYIDSLEQSKKINLLYEKIENETNFKIASSLSRVIKELNLFDYEKIMNLLKNSDFKKQKLGLRISTYDKAFYGKEDVKSLTILQEYISLNFKERGELSTKKQLLSAKEKEVWICECGNKSNEIDQYCGSCNNDIFGFKPGEMKLSEIINYINQKIELIQENII